MKINFNLRQHAPITAFSCEALGLLALGLTPDVEKSLIVAAIAAAAVAWIAKVSIQDRILLLLIVLLVLLGYATAGSAPTGTMMARALIPAHALLWFAKEEYAIRFWRIGVALMEIVLAAILAPEVHMFILIFGFVVLSSLSLSLGFLERNFRSRDPESLGRALRPSFVGFVLALSCVVFLSSLVIFPLLPRSQWGGNNNGTNAGYSDVVSFQQGILYWAHQDSRPALWIFRSSNRAWETIVPFFLLRGQPLEKFNGHEWRARPRVGSGIRLPHRNDDVTVEILRQALPSDVLPVPYGTREVTGSGELTPTQYGGGDWLAGGSRFNSVKYSVTIGDFDSRALGEDVVKETLQFDSVRFQKIRDLGTNLVAGAATTDEKILRIQRFFRDGGFEYELAPVEAYRPGQQHPLEKFLFETKKGHCELFASAAALLFRSVGIPARLVVGFRVRPPNRGDVLTVRSSDAHAWVEVWKSGRGWMATDPTPVLYERGWLRDTAGEAYDWIGAYWHRYILEYEFDFKSLIANFVSAVSSMVGAISAFLTLSGLFLLWRRKKGKADPRQSLSNILYQFEDDLVHLAGLYPEQAFRYLPNAKKWKADYIELRFGRVEPSSADLKKLRREARVIVSTAGQVPLSANAAETPKSVVR